MSKASLESEKIELLKSKPLLGQFFIIAASYRLKIAAQDQAINTRYHQKNILKHPIERCQGESLSSLGEICIHYEMAIKPGRSE